jgi:alpha-L-rhamnosidase
MFCSLREVQPLFNARGLLNRIAAVALLLIQLLSPQAAVASGLPAAAPPGCDSWTDDVAGPVDRSLQPVAAWWADGTHLGEPSGAAVRLSQPGPALILDFGRVVSGKIEADVNAASGAGISFSTSESLEFLGAGSDTHAYGNGDITYRPSGGREGWHAFARRTFRYLLVALVEPGWVQFNRIGTYYTAALGPPSAFKGYFQSSDPLLDHIWYQSAYTLQLVSAAGSSSPLDGAFEVWRGQLDMAAGTESRVLVAGPGADWRDYTFDFDLTIAPSGGGGGWVVRATGTDRFLAFRLANPRGERTSRLDVWQGTRGGSAVLLASHSLELVVQPTRPYHVRVDVAGTQVATLIDGHVVSADSAAGFATGGVGFWAAAGDQFDVAHPRVFSATGTLLFEDRFDGGGVYLDPALWPGAPQAVLLDGAKRDRAVGVADLAIAGSSQYFSFGNLNLMRSLLSVVGTHQYADGKIPGGMLGSGAFSPEDANLPDYTFWWILAVGDYIRQSGDLHALEQLFPVVQSALAWGDARRSSNGLLSKGPGVDWYWSAARGPGPTTSLNALYVGSLLVGAELADDINHTEQRDRYLRSADDVRAAVNANLWDPATGAYVDGDLRDHHPLDGNALAVVFGVAVEQRAASVLSFLHDRLWTPTGTVAADLPYGAWAQDGAIWPAYVGAEVEARFATHDDTNALELVRRTWGSMLTRDPSSSIWEFEMSDGSIHDGSTSLAHGWSTGALAELSRWVLGVQPLRPGYAEYLVSPHPGDLPWACGAVPTPSGPIRVSWEQADGMLTVWFDAPSGASGRFVAPPAASDQALVDGAAAELVQLSPSELGLAGLPPGPHTIQVQLHATQEGKGTRPSA